MKKKLLKAFSSALAITMAVTMFSACSTKKAEPQQTPSPAATTTAEKPYEIDWLAPMGTNAPVDPAKDLSLKDAEEALNVKFKIEMVDVQQYGQKLGLRIASGSVPDIVRIEKGLSLDDYRKYVTQGVFADITTMVSQKDTPNILKSIDQSVLDKSKVKGKIYGIPYNTGPGAGYRFVTMYRKDYLDSIGAKPAKTLDEYYSQLKKIKETKPDVIPLGAFSSSLGEQRYANNSFDHVIGAFGVTPGYFYMNGDKVDQYDISPKMKEALAYLQKMYKEGLIDKEFATLKEPNLKEKYVAGKVFSDISWWTNPSLYDKEIEIFELKKQGKLDKDGTIKEDLDGTPFKYIDFGQVLLGSDGKAVAGFGSEFGTITCISAKTKDVKRVLSIIDKACTEEVNMLLNWGKKDRDYVIKDGKMDGSIKGGVDPKTNLYADGFHRSVGFSLAPNIKGVPRYMDSLQLRRSSPIQASLGTPGQIADAAAFLVSDTKTTKFKELCTLRDTVFTQIIMGADIGKFDEFVTKWKAQGGDDILKELTQSYKEQMGK